MNYKHCPVCGDKLLISKHEEDQAPVCQNPNCRFIFWQNPKPCSSIIIPDEQGRVLMTVRGIQPDKGKLDLPGGFLNESEPPEGGAKREAHEELGIDIEIVKCVGFAIDTYTSHGGKITGHTLNIGLEAKIISGEPQALDEITAIKWIDPQNPPLDRLAFTNNAYFLKMHAKTSKLGLKS